MALRWQAYLYSWGFENAATAQISIMGINFLTGSASHSITAMIASWGPELDCSLVILQRGAAKGFVFVMAYYIMLSIPKTEAAAIEAVKFFRLFPSYNIGTCLDVLPQRCFDGL